MRSIGRRLPAISAQPSAENLRQAAQHLATSAALAAVCSTGVAKGIYRFKSPEEADAQIAQGLARVMVANALSRQRLR